MVMWQTREDEKEGSKRKKKRREKQGDSLSFHQGS